jgi:hypothetical protein
MSAFKNYEIKVLELLAISVLSSQKLAAVIREAKFVSYEYTGSGYFLIVTHPILPKERTVQSHPVVMGHADGIDCGFVLHVENGSLTLECHTWGATDVPEGFRDRDVQVEVAEADASGFVRKSASRQ